MNKKNTRGFGAFIAAARPRTLSDLAVAVALSRPGPMVSGMADAYLRGGVARKAPQRLPALTPILRPTRGLFVFREQIEETLKIVAGLSRQQAAKAARMLAEKDPAKVEQVRETFKKGTARNGYRRDRVDSLFDCLYHYAGYACSLAKSHALARKLSAKVETGRGGHRGSR